jgi:hypothetical protein
MAFKNTPYRMIVLVNIALAINILEVYLKRKWRCCGRRDWVVRPAWGMLS